MFTNTPLYVGLPHVEGLLMFLVIGQELTVMSPITIVPCIMFCNEMVWAVVQHIHFLTE